MRRVRIAYPMRCRERVFIISPALSTHGNTAALCSHENGDSTAAPGAWLPSVPPLGLGFRCLCAPHVDMLGWRNWTYSDTPMVFAVRIGAGLPGEGAGFGNLTVAFSTTAQP